MHFQVIITLYSHDIIVVTTNLHEYFYQHNTSQNQTKGVYFYQWSGTHNQYQESKNKE